MIEVTITVTGDTVNAALANAHSIVIAHQHYIPRRGGIVILDGVTRDIVKGGNTVLGRLSATGNDADKLAHYTGKD